MAVDLPPPPVLPVQAAPPGRAASIVSLTLLLVSVGFAVAGQFTLKWAMLHVGRIGRVHLEAPLQTILRVAAEPRLWLGLTLFGISAAFWLIVLSRVPLSVAYPLAGMSYVVVVLLSRLFLHEHVPPLRWIGVVVIAAGVAMIGLSYHRLTGS